MCFPVGCPLRLGLKASLAAILAFFATSPALHAQNSDSSDVAALKAVVSAFLCAGRFLALLSTLKRVVLTTSAGAGETVSKKRSALAGPDVNNA